MTEILPTSTSNSPVEHNAGSESYDDAGRIEVSVGPHNHAVMKKLLPFRANFVKEMQWETKKANEQFMHVEELNWLLNAVPGDAWLDASLPVGVAIEDVQAELDYYDSLDDTVHYVVTDHDNENKVVAGMRLTRVSSIEDSLSWSMFDQRPDIVDGAYRYVEIMHDVRSAAASGKLYDLTRLVTPNLDNHPNPVQVIKGMLELFAVAYDMQRRHLVDDVERGEIRWFFTGTSRLVSTLSHLQIHYDVIAQGVINEVDRHHSDEGISYLCVVGPESALRYIRDELKSDDPEKKRLFAFPARYIEIGFDKARYL